MVRGRTPSFPRNFDFWSQASDSMPSPGLCLGMDTPSTMKVGLNLMSATANFSWSPLLSGLKGSGDVFTFPSFATEDASSPASSNAGSGKDVGADIGSALQLPAWCSEDTMSVDDVDDMMKEKAPSSAPTARPLRRLRHTGKLRKSSTATVIDHESDTEAASPDLDGGAPTKSTFVDPYLYPTPANRPLRQYVSAPELQSQRYLAAPGNRTASGGMSSSLSMDDILVEMGWPSSRDGEFGGQGLGVSSMDASGREEVEAGPSSISSAGPTLPPSAPAIADVAEHQHAPFGYTEISGSLYRRRAQTKEGQMPSPTPIHTSAGTPTPQRQEASQGPSYQQRMTSSVFQPVPPPLMPSTTQSAPLVGLSQQEQQQLDLQRMQLQQLAIQAGANVNIFEDFVAPAQQHAGQESSEKTARAVQAALLYGTDQYARRSSIDALNYSLSSGLVSGSMGPMGEPAAGMDQTLYGGPSAGGPPPVSEATQAASSQPRFLVYSGGAAPPTMGGAPAVGFTSTYPGSGAGPASGPQPSMMPGRPRKQSMPANMLSRQRATSIGGSAAGGTLNPTAAFSGPQLTPGESVPLMPVYTHAHAHAVPPSAIMGSMAGSSAAAMGPWAPSSATATATATMPGSATSATTSHQPSTGNSLFSWPPRSADSYTTQGSHGAIVTPQTPPPREASPQQSASGSGSAKGKAKKVRSTPNFAATTTTPTPADASPRKIASNRRVQSSKDLRGDSAERAAASAGGESYASSTGMFDFAPVQMPGVSTPSRGKKVSSGVVGGTPSTPAAAHRGSSTSPGGSSSTTTPGRPAGFSFVNYGIEDAQELCAAVAPSGSYKIPLKGYGGPGSSTSGSGSGSGAQQQQGPREQQQQQQHKAPSAAVKTKHRPRAQVDNSLWIQETGEDSGDEEEDDEEGDSHSPSASGSGSHSGSRSGAGSSRSGWGSGSEDELRAGAGAVAGAEERSKKRPRVRTSTTGGVPSAKQGQGMPRQRKKSNNV